MIEFSPSNENDLSEATKNLLVNKSEIVFIEAIVNPNLNNFIRFKAFLSESFIRAFERTFGYRYAEAIITDPKFRKELEEARKPLP